ncbi:MAG: hypothetical protein NPMRTH1_820018 [Nitrosopumilales archaeon]|nr:MAG: hypothetical protein NPMRTH1_820018 [Nitrosopumilales archaeon]
MSRDEQIKKPLEDFITRAAEIIDELSAEKMISESAINPILAQALGFSDFRSLARFYVYQRISRSLVTSFGTHMENLVKSIIDGEKGDWWDVVKKSSKINYYVSVKSGPRDMNKDQTVEFSRRAKRIMEEDPKALPIIAMGYGKKAWPVITDTLKNQGLDPNKHSYVGKNLYTLLTGDKNYYKKLLNIVVNVESKVIGKKTILQLMDEKVDEIAKEFKNKYKNVDELLSDTF